MFGDKFLLNKSIGIKSVIYLSRLYRSVIYGTESKTFYVDSFKRFMDTSSIIKTIKKNDSLKDTIITIFPNEMYGRDVISIRFFFTRSGRISRLLLKTRDRNLKVEDIGVTGYKKKSKSRATYSSCATIFTINCQYVSLKERIRSSV